MHVLEAIAARRAVKQFVPDRPMPEEDVERLLSAAALAPTSFNIQHLRVVRVADREQRRRLREAGWGQSQITDASELWILCADIQAWQKEPERYWRHADADTRNMILPMLRGFYAGKPELQRDEALRTVGIVAQTIMLAAKSLGYDSCPMVGYDAEAVAALINLPSDHLVGMMVAIGHAARPAWPRGGSLEREEIVMLDRFV